MMKTIGDSAQTSLRNEFYLIARAAPEPLLPLLPSPPGSPARFQLLSNSDDESAALSEASSRQALRTVQSSENLNRGGSRGGMKKDLIMGTQSDGSSGGGHNHGRTSAVVRTDLEAGRRVLDGVRTVKKRRGGLQSGGRLLSLKEVYRLVRPLFLRWDYYCALSPLSFVYPALPNPSSYH
jgi:hypothetical protein